MIDGKLFTSYDGMIMWFKPILLSRVYFSRHGKLTRGFPIKTRADERIDHPHQIGMWLTYGMLTVNDFLGKWCWVRNKNAIAE